MRFSSHLADDVFALIILVSFPLSHHARPGLPSLPPAPGFLVRYRLNFLLVSLFFPRFPPLVSLPEKPSSLVHFARNFRFFFSRFLSFHRGGGQITFSFSPGPFIHCSAGSVVDLPSGLPRTTSFGGLHNVFPFQGFFYAWGTFLFGLGGLPLMRTTPLG